MKQKHNYLGLHLCLSFKNKCFANATKYRKPLFIYSFNQFRVEIFRVKVAGDRIFISMHLCKEYARITTTHTDNTRNIYEKVP